MSGAHRNARNVPRTRSVWVGHQEIMSVIVAANMASTKLLLSLGLQKAARNALLPSYRRQDPRVKVATGNQLQSTGTGHSEASATHFSNASLEIVLVVPTTPCHIHW